MKKDIKHRIRIVGLVHFNNPISNEDEDDLINIDIEDEYVIRWDNEKLFNDLTDEHGIYVIYDYQNRVIYVGKTWDKKGFKQRFSSHRTDEEGYFPYWELVGKNVRFYCVKDRIQMLTLERIKIQQHLPDFNKEDISKSDSASSKKYVRKNILKKLWRLTDRVKDVIISSKKYDGKDEYIRLMIVNTGYYKVEEMLKANNKEIILNWLDAGTDTITSLRTSSDNYSRGLQELVFTESNEEY